MKQHERLCDRILVLDEATSSLDTVCEARVQRLVLDLLRQLAERAPACRSHVRID